jgi:hypothetical protein
LGLLCKKRTLHPIFARNKILRAGSSAVCTELHRLRDFVICIARGCSPPVGENGEQPWFAAPCRLEQNSTSGQVVSIVVCPASAGIQSARDWLFPLWEQSRRRSISPRYKRCLPVESEHHSPGAGRGAHEITVMEATLIETSWTYQHGRTSRSRWAAQGADCDETVIFPCSKRVRSDQNASEHPVTRIFKGAVLRVEL